MTLVQYKIKNAQKNVHSYLVGKKANIYWILTTARHCFKCLAYINLFNSSQDNSMTSMLCFQEKKKSNHTTKFPWLAGGRAFTVPVWFSRGPWQRYSSYILHEHFPVRVKAVDKACHWYFHPTERTLESEPKPAEGAKWFCC